MSEGAAAVRSGVWECEVGVAFRRLEGDEAGGCCIDSWSSASRRLTSLRSCDVSGCSRFISFSNWWVEGDNAIPLCSLELAAVISWEDARCVCAICLFVDDCLYNGGSGG